MILKTIDSKLGCLQVLYTNIRVNESDCREQELAKRDINKNVSRVLSSKRSRMQALILENFTSEDWYATFTFRDDTRPDIARLCSQRWSYFRRKLALAGYQDIRWLRVLEDKHGERKFHFHCVIGGAPRSALIDAWGGTYGDAKVVKLNLNRVYPRPGRTGLAGYMAKELSDDVGRRSYSRSRSPTLRDPVITREIVPDDFQLIVPVGCRTIKRGVLAENPFGYAEVLSYIKY